MKGIKKRLKEFFLRITNTKREDKNYTERDCCFIMRNIELYYDSFERSYGNYYYGSARNDDYYIKECEHDLSKIKKLLIEYKICTRSIEKGYMNEAITEAEEQILFYDKELLNMKDDYKERKTILKNIKNKGDL